jgi:hypothetical protein
LSVSIRWNPRCFRYTSLCIPLETRDSSCFVSLYRTAASDS